MNKFAITFLPTATLLPYAGNPRTHSAKQVNQIAASIREFGFINPIVVDATEQVVAGHCRLLAAKRLKLAQVPVIKVEHLSEAQRTAYALADNRLAENAGWDKSLLRVELEKLLNVEIDFSIESTGFDEPEIDFIVHGSRDGIDVPVPLLPAADVLISRVGDVWQLGQHIIVCGDCRTMSGVDHLLADVRITMVITDPPFNVKVAGHASGLGKTQHREFAMASGEMSSPAFTDFLADSLKSMSDLCHDGALVYVFMDWRHLNELQMARDAVGLQQINLCVWTKTNAGMGTMYRSQHELVAVLKKGTASHINNVELGKHGRYRTNVWKYAGMNTFGAERDAALAMHPTVKPVAMIRDAILDASRPRDWVFDGFLGSGTTLLAAEQCGRRCLGFEIDPAYVDVALARWQTLTGTEPVHLTSHSSLSEVRKQRGVTTSTGADHD